MQKPVRGGLHTQIYSAACKPSTTSHFDADYLIRTETEIKQTEKWTFPAGYLAQFEYSGLHGLDEKGILRIRLLMSIVINSWFSDNHIYWDRSFIETVDLAKCAEYYCELSFPCFTNTFDKPLF